MFGMNRRLLTFVTWRPMPPFFFALPLREMLPPTCGRFPVISQTLAIIFLPQFLVRGAEITSSRGTGKPYLVKKWPKTAGISRDTQRKLVPWVRKWRFRVSAVSLELRAISTCVRFCAKRSRWGWHSSCQCANNHRRMSSCRHIRCPYSRRAMSS